MDRRPRLRRQDPLRRARPGIDPLGPDNKLVVAVGPISGIPAPNTGKTVVAAQVARDRRLRRREPRHARHRPAPQGGLRRPDRRGPGRAPDDALHRGRPGRVPAGRRGLGQGHRSRPTTGSTPSTARASASSTSARAARTWSATPSSAASRGGPAAGRAWARSWAPSSSRPSSSRAPSPSRRRSPPR